MLLCHPEAWMGRVRDNLIGNRPFARSIGSSLATLTFTALIEQEGSSCGFEAHSNGRWYS